MSTPYPRDVSGWTDGEWVILARANLTDADVDRLLETVQKVYAGNKIASVSIQGTAINVKAFAVIRVFPYRAPTTE